MKKEIILSILIGLTFGLIITFAVYKSKNKPPETTKTLSPEQTNQTKSSLAPTDQDNQIVLHSPENGQIQTDDSIKINGTTTANVDVIIFVNKDTYASTSDESGHFSVIADLEQGGNLITAYVVDQQGYKSSTQKVVIVENPIINEALESLQQQDLEEESSTESTNSTDSTQTQE